MRLHLVDGTFELFRAHYSKRPEHLAPNGAPIKATAGLVSSLLGLLSDESESVTHLAVAFDNPITSFRNELFAGYKSDTGVEPVLRAQFDLAEQAVRALGIVVWSMDRYEADDALATAAARHVSQFDQVRILSPDKDLMQCVRGQAVVLVDRMRKRVFDEEAVRQTKGIGPSQIPDYLALVGDTADGIPGLRGFGERTASRLLARFGSLESIPHDPARWDVKVAGKERLAAVLASEYQAASLYKTLATLVTDVPLSEQAEQLALQGVPKQRFEAMCETVGLQSLLDRVKSWA